MIVAISFSVIISSIFGTFVLTGMPVLPFEDSMIICHHGMIKMSNIGLIFVICLKLLVFLVPVVLIAVFYLRILCLVSIYLILLKFVVLFINLDEIFTFTLFYEELVKRAFDIENSKFCNFILNFNDIKHQTSKINKIISGLINYFFYNYIL